jgi:outer membrane autotransporter protein
MPLYIGPDLVVSKLKLTPTIVAAGGSINAAFTTKNNGKVGAGATVSRLYYSDDKKLNTTTDTLLATINVPALGPGQAATDNRVITIPGAAPSGLRFIIAVVDVGNLVSEAVESKNTKAVKFTVQ